MHWAKLANDSLRFLVIMHGFRWVTEPGTRDGGVGLQRGYFRAVENLHGWADGDPFYVNYVGHPMQGAVSGRLFLLNNDRFNRTEFGRDREYWRGRIRAAAFAWAFSEQFEIGPFSEASIGHIQSQFPQQGFVDHVITPSAGLGWIIGEDAIDRYVIRPLEDRTTTPWLRILLRTGLNPARSFANLVDGRAPWDRGSRAGVTIYRGDPAKPRIAHASEARGAAEPAPFEFAAHAGYRRFGGTQCMGGGAEGAYRVADDLQLVVAVNGCKFLDQQQDFSGDALIYQVGPRWTPAPAAKWSPYAHLLLGGIKVTGEQLNPAEKAAVEEANQGLDPSLAYTLHDQYTTHQESGGIAVTAGTGIDYKVNGALAIRVASLEYLRTTAGPVNRASFNNGLQFTTGVILRLGTW